MSFPPPTAAPTLAPAAAAAAAAAATGHERGEAEGGGGQAASTGPDTQFRVLKKSQAMKAPWGPSVRYGRVYEGVQDLSKSRAMYGGWD
eukprot:1143320-Pelagomonas_calceolata.AAC.2